jgi:DNA repair exonuclease SbcCD ATPase subunit
MADIAALPEVRLEARKGFARPITYPVADVDFLIGTVPGCDLRVPGANLPPVLCLVSRRPGSVGLRKLVPTQPVAVNGQPVAHAKLAEGDRIAIGSVELIVRVQEVAVAPAAPADSARTAAERLLQEQEQAFQQERQRQEAADRERRRALDELAGELEARRRELQEQTAELEANRVYWYQRRDEIERECRRQLEAVEQARQQQAARESCPVAHDLPQLEEGGPASADELAQLQSTLEQEAADLDRQRQEMAALRQELADIRRQLYDRYQERRDRLAGLQEAVNLAAHKVQERKRLLEGDVQQVKAQRLENEARQAKLESWAAELEQGRTQLDEERSADHERRQEQERELAERLAGCRAQEARLAAAQQALAEGQQQHQADLVRLDRLHASLEQRDKELQARAADLDARFEHLHRETKEMEEQVVQLDDWHVKLSAMAEQVSRDKAAQDAAGAQLVQRAATLEGQQAMLAGLRTRLERMRDEVRQEEQQLTAERARLEALEKGVQDRLQDAEKLRKDLEDDKIVREQERRQIAERSALLETAIQQLHQAQEKVAADEERVRKHAVELAARAAEQIEASNLAEARARQCEELQQRLEAERQALRERAQLVAQAEQAREALQEQLRRRSEELVARQKAVADQTRQLESEAAALEARRGEVEAQHRVIEEQGAALLRQVEERTRELTAQQENLAEREQTLAHHRERLQEAGRAVAGERKTMLEERARLEGQRQEILKAAAQARADFEAARREAIDLQRHLPDLELQAGTAFERLSFARDQLREHIQEVHTYAAQCQEDLEGLRGQVAEEVERLQQREQAVRRAQDEHRLSVAAFRQQLLDWQGQLAEMKRMLAHDETRLERRQAQVSEQARTVDAESQRLARHAQALIQKEQVVHEQRAEMGRHLADMREWYRRKLRELAGIDEPSGKDSGPEPATAPAEVDFFNVEETPLIPARRDILSLTGDVDPADRRLGDQLRALDLIDADTLTALLVEARRQRRSLRQVLLASGAVTLYQIALIEAGDVDALVLGPVRVVDRLQATPHEVLYRVFDPRRGQEALLRHLAEAEMNDAVHPDEYRQRFAQAMLQHPNVAGTLEVLEVAGRPAVLQEWLTGLRSTDWPAFAAAPGAWFRLLTQAALGLQAAHEAGLVHGHLQAEHIVLTSEGVVKVCGVGEPQWLAGPPVGGSHEEPAPDLVALGRIAAGWCPSTGKRKGSRSKALPVELQAILARLCAEEGKTPYATAAALLEDLDRAGSNVPANAEAWDRLGRHVREHGVAQAALRVSA